MKTLYVVRHAKSSHALIGQPDMARPLNSRGIEDATMMAQRLFSQQQIFEAFISSPATRAFTTCSLFAKVFNIPSEKILVEKKLYEAPASAFYEVLKKTENHFSTIALFSHNPGISYFVNSLTDKIIDGMPTCGVFGVEAHIDSWKDFELAKKDFLYFDFPKNH